MSGGMIKNAIECRFCGVVIESEFRHDFVVHSCQALQDHHKNPEAMIGVDGGRAYARRIFTLPGDYIDRSEYAPE